MKKIVKKYGNSHVIILDPEDLKIFKLKEGDIIDIADLVVIKKKKIILNKSLPRENNNASKELGKSRSNKLTNKKKGKISSSL